jgi:hypothetical protein
VVGVRDFNGDGTADMLFRRSTDGLMSLFFMNGFQIISAATIGVVDPAFAVAGLGDFNGDARSDIAFRRASDGALSIYLMNGAQVLQAASLGAVGTEFATCYGQPPLSVASAQ